jgi:hypothetical protein
MAARLSWGVPGSPEGSLPGYKDPWGGVQSQAQSYYNNYTYIIIIIINIITNLA